MFWWAALFFMYSRAAQNKIVIQRQHLMANFSFPKQHFIQLKMLLMKIVFQIKCCLGKLMFEFCAARELLI